MANLIPFGKDSSSIIKPSKLLSSSLVKRDNTAIVAKPNSDGKILFTIKNKVIKIDKLLKSSLLTTKKDTEKKRTLTEQEKFKNREKELEKQKPKAIKGINIPTPPRLGLFDWIKNFVFNTFLGFIAVRLIDHLPTLIKLTPIIFSAGEFIIDMGGKLLDGLVTFVDKSYEVVDKSRQFAKTLGGDGLLQNFDKFNGALSKMLDIAVIAAISAATMGDDFGSPGSPGATDFLKVGGKRGVNPQVVRRFIERYGIDAARQKFGQEGIKSLGGKFARSGITNLARKGLVATLGKSGVKGVLRLAKPLLGRIPLIGGLLEFGLSWALGDPIGRAAFKGVGALLVGAVGTAIGGPIGAAIGGFVGGEVGGKLYDIFFNNKKPNQKTVKAAGGGKPATRGGKLVSGPAKRTVKKKKTPRTVKATAPRLRPGGAVGGEKNIKKLFPDSKNKKQMNSFEFLKKTYDIFSKSTGLGSLVALAMKPVLGDRPTTADYKNAGVGINNWMNRSIASGTLAYAGGGEVKMESIVSGEDYSDVIARSVKDSVSSEVDKAIQDLMRQLMLQPSSQPAGVPGPAKPGDPSTVDIQGGDADFWTLVAIASREDGDPQSWADVAQSIYNRLASGAYTGKTIRELILGQMQYEPTWKFPRPGVTGKPNPEWFAIKDAASAGVAAGQSEGAMKKVAAALLDPALQKNARDFIQGRTDFRGYSVSGGVQRKAGDNYFGWYNNYRANKIGSVPNFGATASAGAGPGVSGPLGAGRVGAVDQFTAIAKKFGLKLTSAYRPGRGYHGKNRARDYSNDTVGRGTPQQLAFAKHLVQNYGSSLTQLIYTPLGFGIANGKKVGLDYWGDATNAIHYHHVHVALAKGGRVKKKTFAMLGENGPEFVFDADTTAVLDKLAPGMLERLNLAETKPQIDSILQSYMSYDAPYGGEPEVVYVPVEVPVGFPVPVGGGMIMSSGGGIDSTYDTLEII